MPQKSYELVKFFASDVHSSGIPSDNICDAEQSIDTATT
jgi:hypothetical protein